MMNEQDYFKSDLRTFLQRTFLYDGPFTTRIKNVLKHTLLYEPLRKIIAQSFQTNEEIIHDLTKKIGDAHLIIEIGAYDGTDSITLSRYFPRAQIIAIEADKKNYKLLHNNTQFVNNIYTHNYAISNKKGTTMFYTHENGTTNTLMQPLTKGYTKNKVQTRTLDSLNIPLIIDLLWIDAEGAERLILKGARKTLLNTRYVYLEYGEEGQYKRRATLNELVQLLAKTHPFVKVYGGNALFRRETRGEE